MMFQRQGQPLAGASSQRAQWAQLLWVGLALGVLVLAVVGARGVLNPLQLGLFVLAWWLCGVGCYRAGRVSAAVGSGAPGGEAQPEATGPTAVRSVEGYPPCRS